MKHIATRDFNVFKGSNYSHDFHVHVEEYVTFYSVSITKFGWSSPSIVDFRVKKKLVDGSYSAFKYVYSHFLS